MFGPTAAFPAAGGESEERPVARSPSVVPDQPAGSPADRRAAEREARLASALRANLRRRKAQSRARQDATEDAREAARGQPPPLRADAGDGGGA